MKNKQPSISNQLRTIIDTCGLSRYAIANGCEIDHSAMSRFMNGERGLSTTNLDRIGEFLDLRLTMGKPNKKGGK
jgi:DNA transposition AAA+ family ATPase